MIVKMKFLTITGPKDNLDRVIEKYLYKYEFQLENALTELKNIENLIPYYGISPYKDLYIKSEEFLRLVDISKLDLTSRDISFEDAADTISQIEKLQVDYNLNKIQIEEKLKKLNSSLDNVSPFKDINYNLHEVLNFNFIKYAFGKMPKEYYIKFEKYFESDCDAIFIKYKETETFVWGIYFVPILQDDKIESLFTSLHFEKLAIPTEYEGTATQVYEQINNEIQNYNTILKNNLQKFNRETDEYSKKLYDANQKLYRLSNNFDVRKMAACTSENQTDFFVLCGWMSKQDAKNLEIDISQDSSIYLIEDSRNTSTVSKPPTKLKNFTLFRPFEMFIEMYGLPNYNEIDPTSFVALTYALIFGIMFGDVGQGLCLVLGGFLLYKFKKLRLGAIIGCAGIFSTVFGFLFGSVFGFETIISALWIHPGKKMMTLPFIGNMNLILVVAIAFGMFLILTTMILHIINGIRSKKLVDIIFDTNAISGLIFYFSLISIIYLFMTGHLLPGGVVLFIMFGIPLVLIAFKEPLTNLINKHSEIFPENKGMFFVQTFFEVFEILLSYFSNTISFVRIGAFAISHGAMMEVVLMLAGAESGNINWFVIVIGNLIVCGLEGLIVGIQVLRLQYYEMFSRFYTGGGHAFKPFNRK